MGKSELYRLSVQSGTKLATTQPNWCCLKCGDAWGRRPMNMSSERLATWHIGQCGVCNKTSEVTEARDFGYLKEGWDK